MELKQAGDEGEGGWSGLYHPILNESMIIGCMMGDLFSLWTREGKRRNPREFLP